MTADRGPRTEDRKQWETAMPGSWEAWKLGGLEAGKQKSWDAGKPGSKKALRLVNQED